MLELLSFGTQKSQSKPHFTMIFLKIMICCFSLLKTASYIHTMTRYANKNTSKYSVHFATQPVPIFCWVIKTSVHFFNAYLCYKIAINMTLNTLFVIAVPKVPIISRYFWYATLRKYTFTFWFYWMHIYLPHLQTFCSYYLCSIHSRYF